MAKAGFIANMFQQEGGEWHSTAVVFLSLNLHFQAQTGRATKL